jgi:ABC-type Co2+ transport system permease subunit
MARGFGGGGRALLLMLLISFASALVAAFVILAAMNNFQQPNAPLVSSDRWFLFYMIPVIFFSAIITVMVFTYLAQEKIKWVY